MLEFCCHVMFHLEISIEKLLNPNTRITLSECRWVSSALKNDTYCLNNLMQNNFWVLVPLSAVLQCVLQTIKLLVGIGFVVAVPRTSLAGLQSIVTTCHMLIKRQKSLVHSCLYPHTGGQMQIRTYCLIKGTCQSTACAFFRMPHKYFFRRFTQP